MSTLKTILINNFRCAWGQKKKGVELGGDLILSRLPPTLPIRTLEFKNLNGYTEASKHIDQHIRRNFCLNLGGDHSIAVATVKPLLDIYKDDLLVVWIDAHPDLNTQETSVSKNLHGTPVASLLGLEPYWYSVEFPPHRLKPHNLVYFGIRDIDPPETKFIHQLNIPVYQKSEEVISFLDSHPAKYIHISCDIDAMDPEIMSSTGTPVKDGLTILSVKKIIRHCLPKLISFDLVEFNPLLGDREKTLNNIMEILSTVNPTLTSVNKRLD